MIYYYVIVVTETTNGQTDITGTIGLFTTEEHAIEHASQIAGPVPNDAVEYHIEPVLPWIGYKAPTQSEEPPVPTDPLH